MFFSVSYDYVFEYCSSYINLHNACFSNKIYNVPDACFFKYAFLQTTHKVR